LNRTWAGVDWRTYTHAIRARCFSVIFAIIIVRALCILRRGTWLIARLRRAGGKIGLDHAGDDGARHVEIERSDGRI
jgi:hypothetical protein